MKIKFILIFAVINLVTSSISFSQIKSIDTGKLVEMMEGSFSSEEQSKSDSDYYDIRLHMKRIWPEISSAYYLYVEQAVASSQDKPYRQRVYRITNTYEGRFESAVFTMKDPLRFAGEWKKENPMSEFTPDSLTLREGCSVILTLMNDDTYEGSTEGNNCESDLRGAKYATSEVKIYEDKIISWDRGYDADGKQVWGAEKGGYIFKKVMSNE
jgi:hypothetical protein